MNVIGYFLITLISVTRVATLLPRACCQAQFGRMMRTYREEHGQVTAIGEVVSLTRA